MKKTIILILTLSLILAVFSSCGHKTVDPIDNQTSSSPSEDTSTEITADETSTNAITTTEVTEERIETTTEEDNSLYVPEYTVEKIDGQYYMFFADDIKPTYSGVLSSVKYSSLYALKYDIPNGNMDVNAWRIFQRDILRSNPMPLYDIEHIWQAKVPDGWVVKDEFDWYGDSYIFHICNDDESKNLRFEICNEDYYNEYLLPEAEEYLNKYDTPENPMRKIQSGDITAYYYSFGNDDMYSILFSNGKYFCYIRGDLPSDLTDEEILAFGVEEYLG